MVGSWRVLSLSLFRQEFFLISCYCLNMFLCVHHQPGQIPSKGCIFFRLFVLRMSNSLTPQPRRYMSTAQSAVRQPCPLASRSSSWRSCAKPLTPSPIPSLLSLQPVHPAHPQRGAGQRYPGVLPDRAGPLVLPGLLHAEHSGGSSLWDKRLRQSRYPYITLHSRPYIHVNDDDVKSLSV